MTTNTPISVLLIDDQPIVGEAIRGMLRDEPDITLHFCTVGSNAVKMALEVKPTVILQDLIMPDIDGFKLLCDFRQCEATKDVPLIVLSSKEDADAKAQGFRHGANDYMVKLPDRLELIARIRYHSAAYTRLLERNDAYKKLEASQKTMHQELTEAADYVKSQLPRPIVNGDIRAQWQFLPSEQLGGDAFGYQWVDKQHFVFYLLDVCGHGVGAALLSLSIIHVLWAQLGVPNEFLDPSQVLKKLNIRYPMDKHNDMFFTIWFGVYDQTAKILTYANGGHPAAVVVRHDAAGIKKNIELTGQGPAIGLKPEVQFKNETFSIEKGDRLYLYSDGIFELQTTEGRVMTRDEFLPVFTQSSIAGKSEIQRMVEHSKSLTANGIFDDDVSILEITFYTEKD